MASDRASARHVRYGPGAIDEIPSIVADAGWERVLLVCGSSSFEASGAARILPALAQVATTFRFDEFAPNTDADDLVRGLEMLDTDPVDAIIGIGGGSALDMAKLLVAFAGLRDRDEVYEAIRLQRLGPRRHALVLVPTTSGSGSEATHFAVVYIGHTKFSVAGPQLRADEIVLDPLLARSGSRHQRATSGVDAICQAIESMWAVGATDCSRRDAAWALTHLLPSIRPFVDSSDAMSAKAMSIGSHLAGRAIDLSKTTAAHALSYRITKQFGVSHGNAVALTLGAFIDVHSSVGDERLQPLIEPATHRATMAVIRGRLGLADGDLAQPVIQDLLVDLGLPCRLTDVGASEHDLDALVAAVNPERLDNNPVMLTAMDLYDVLSASL